VSRFKLVLILFIYAYSSTSSATAFRRLSQDDCDYGGASGSQLIEVANKAQDQSATRVACKNTASLGSDWDRVAQENLKRMAKIYCSVDGSPITDLPNPALTGKKKQKALKDFRAKYAKSNGILFEESGLILTTRHSVSDKPQVVSKPKACVVEDSLGGIHRIQTIHYANPKDVFGMTGFADQAVLELKDPFPPEITPIKVAIPNPQVNDELLHLSNFEPDSSLTCTATLSTITSVSAPIGQMNGQITFSGKYGKGHSGGPLLNKNGELVGSLFGTAGPDKKHTRPAGFTLGEASIYWKYRLDTHLSDD
jgi:hypothetical protein